MHGDATALLIIRAWNEEGSSQPLRAQVRMTSDLSEGFTQVVTVIDADAIRACVEDWLRILAAE